MEGSGSAQIMTYPDPQHRLWIGIVLMKIQIRIGIKTVPVRMRILPQFYTR